jgi:hypothetical protein
MKPTTLAKRRSVVFFDTVKKPQMKQGTVFHNQALETAIKAEWEKHGKNITIDKEKARHVINYLKEKAFTIDYDKIIVEITPKNSVAFKFIFYFGVNEKVVVLVDKPFLPNNEVNEDEALISIIRNGNPILLDIQNLDDIIESTQIIRSVFEE